MGQPKLSERQERFVAKPRIGVLASTRPDGSPHTAPVWYRYEDGVFIVLTEPGSRKGRNIRRDARVELCIDDDQPPYHTVIVRGRATFAGPSDEAFREALAIHYLGEEGGRRYIREQGHPLNEVVRIVPEDVRGW